MRTSLLKFSLTSEQEWRALLGRPVKVEPQEGPPAQSHHLRLQARFSRGLGPLVESSENVTNIEVH